MSDDARIYDIRYATYAGPRGGRAEAILSLARWGALRAMGARRGWRAKILPIVLCLCAAGPALALLGVRALLAEFTDEAPIDILDILPYGDYQQLIGIVILLFAVVIAPELLCPDRRDGVLALYFSTAVGPREYLAGRVLAAIGPLLLVTVLPMLVMFIGITFFADGSLQYLADHWLYVPRILASGVLLAVYYALLALAISSFTDKRAYAMGAYLLVLLSAAALSGLLMTTLDEDRILPLLDIAGIPFAIIAAMFPDVSSASTPLPLALVAYAAVVAACAAILVRRHRPESL